MQFHTRENPFPVGCGASVEMIGLVDFLTLLPLSLVAGVVTLAHWCDWQY